MLYTCYSPHPVVSGELEFEEIRSDFQSQGDVARCFLAYHSKRLQTRALSLERRSLRSLSVYLNRTRSHTDSVLFTEQVAKKAKGFDRADELRALGVSHFSSRMHRSLNALPSAPAPEFTQPRKVATLAPTAMPQTRLERGAIPTAATTAPQASLEQHLPLLHPAAVPTAATVAVAMPYQYQPQYQPQSVAMLPYQQASWMPQAAGYVLGYTPAALSVPRAGGRRQHCTTCGAPLLSNPHCRGSNCRTFMPSSF